MMNREIAICVFDEVEGPLQNDLAALNLGRDPLRVLFTGSGSHSKTSQGPH